MILSICLFNPIKIVNSIENAEALTIKPASINSDESFYDLSDLFVLCNLFNDKNSGISLGELFIMDRLFNGDRSGIFLKNNKFSLGDLLVINELFRQSSPGVLDENDLIGNIFILDKLFNK